MSSSIAVAVCTALPSSHLHYCEYLHDRIAEQPLAESWWLMLVDDSSLSIEHALQLQSCERILFVQIDADTDSAPGYSLAALEVEAGHKILPAEGDLSPTDLMHALTTMSRHDHGPRGFVLRVSAPLEEAASSSSGGNGSRRPGSAGREISPEVKATLDAVAAFLAELLEHSDLDDWLMRCKASQQARSMAFENQPGPRPSGGDLSERPQKS